MPRGQYDRSKMKRNKAPKNPPTASAPTKSAAPKFVLPAKVGTPEDQEIAKFHLLCNNIRALADVYSKLGEGTAQVGTLGKKIMAELVASVDTITALRQEFLGNVTGVDVPRNEVQSNNNTVPLPPAPNFSASLPST